ncbi:MAG: hypothetical protein ACI9XR_001394 [Flavobacterium sp.]|jgi:hypothetical protein
MNELINDLLEYSKSSMDLENVEDFDLPKLITDQFESLTYGMANPKTILICNTLAKKHS